MAMQALSGEEARRDADDEWRALHRRPDASPLPEDQEAIDTSQRRPVHEGFRLRSLIARFGHTDVRRALRRRPDDPRVAYRIARDRARPDDAVDVDARRQPDTRRPPRGARTAASGARSSDRGLLVHRPHRRRGRRREDTPRDRTRLVRHERGMLVLTRRRRRAGRQRPPLRPVRRGIPRAPADPSAVIGSCRQRVRALTTSRGWSPRRSVVGRRTVPHSRRGRRRGPRLFGSVQGLLGRISVETPVLLALEDLQWADPSSRSLLLSTARQLGGTRVVLVGTFRSDDWVGGTRSSPRWRCWSGCRTSSGSTSSASRRQRSTNRSRASSGPSPRLASSTRSWNAPTATLLRGGTPGRRPAARTQRCPADDPGRHRGPAERPAGRDAAGGPDRGRRRAADGARPSRDLAGLSESSADRRHPSRGRRSRPCTRGRGRPAEYAFRHALVREVAYDDLLPTERSALHGLVAEALSAQPDVNEADARSAAELAYHWSGAHDDRRALGASLRAARTATEIYAHDEALEHYERAIRLWSRVAEAADGDGDRPGIPLRKCGGRCIECRQRAPRRGARSPGD